MPPLKTGFADSYYNSVYRVARFTLNKPDRAKETLTVKRCAPTVGTRRYLSLVGVVEDSKGDHRSSGAIEG